MATSENTVGEVTPELLLVSICQNDSKTEIGSKNNRQGPKLQAHSSECVSIRWWASLNQSPLSVI